MSPSEKSTNPRKKVCTKCGRRLWLRDFYAEKGRRRSWCKECDKQRSRERYSSSKVQDGIQFRDATGRIEEHSGTCWRIVWSERMIYELKRYYPNTANEELADLLNVSKSTLYRKAKELGLKKDKEFMRKQACEASLMAREFNKERRLKYGILP